MIYPFAYQKMREQWWPAMDFSKGMAGRAAITRLALICPQLFPIYSGTYILFYKQLTADIPIPFGLHTAYFFKLLTSPSGCSVITSCEALLVTDYGPGWFTLSLVSVFSNDFYLQRGFYLQHVTNFIIRTSQFAPLVLDDTINFSRHFFAPYELMYHFLKAL